MSVVDDSRQLDAVRRRLRQLYDAAGDAKRASDTAIIAKELVETLRSDIRPHELPLAASISLSSSESLLAVR